MFRHRKKFAIAFLAFGGLMQTTGCSTPDQSRLAGQIVGTGVGIVAGAQFGDGLGTAFAVAHGAWLGFNLGELVGTKVPDN